MKPFPLVYNTTRTQALLNFSDYIRIKSFSEDITHSNLKEFFLGTWGTVGLFMGMI